MIRRSLAAAAAFVAAAAAASSAIGAPDAVVIVCQTSRGAIFGGRLVDATSGRHAGARVEIVPAFGSTEPADLGDTLSAIYGAPCDAIPAVDVWRITAPRDVAYADLGPPN